MSRAADIYEAAADELGIELENLDRHYVDWIVDHFAHLSTKAAKSELRDATKEFEGRGRGRGVELADFIDQMRVLIAVRKARSRKR